MLVSRRRHNHYYAFVKGKVRASKPPSNYRIPEGTLVTKCPHCETIVKVRIAQSCDVNRLQNILKGDYIAGAHDIGLPKSFKDGVPCPGYGRKVRKVWTQERQDS